MTHASPWTTAHLKTPDDELLFHTGTETRRKSGVKPFLLLCGSVPPCDPILPRRVRSGRPIARVAHAPVALYLSWESPPSISLPRFRRLPESMTAGRAGRWDEDKGDAVLRGLRVSA
jgi:hypothetical protein